MMRFLAVAATGVVAACAAHDAWAGNWTWADRPFDGTWLAQPDHTTFDGAMRAPTFGLDGGLLRRSDCRGGAIEVPTDGQDHEIKDQPLFDSMSVRVTDDRHVGIIEKRGGKLAWRGEYTVSEDGSAMKLDYADERAAKPVTGELSYHREGARINGSRPFSGTWRPDKLTRLSASGLALTIATQPTVVGADNKDLRFSLVASDGRSASGNFDMHENVVQGYLPGASIALARLRPDMLQINRTVNGELVEMSRATVSADGQTMTLDQVDWMCQSKATFTLHRKPAP